MAVGSYIRKLGISNTASAHYIADDWMKLYTQANSNASSYEGNMTTTELTFCA